MSNCAMSNETDLDWLARNVHEWPIDAKFAVSPGMGEVLFYEHHYPRLVQFSRNQWLARRAEFQNKPSWANHQWPQIFQNEDGNWFGARAGWDFKAHIGGGWKGEVVSLLRDDGEYLQSGEVIGDWRDTLEKRPDMYKNKEEIDTSSECVQKTEESVHISELEMLAKVSHLISDKRHRNQFKPFVSAEDAATAKQPAPKGSGSPILGMVLADLTNRALEGKEKYGEPLLAHNGRNPLWDAYQEALDLAMYLRQAIEELG